MQVSHSVCLFLCLSLLLPLLQEDDDGPLGAPDYDTISENGLLSRNEPIRSKVSKLTEKLRKRYPTTSTGQSALTYPLFSFLPYIIPQWLKKDILWTDAFEHESHKALFLCLSTQATVLAAMQSSQCWRKGWDWKLEELEIYLGITSSSHLI